MVWSSDNQLPQIVAEGIYSQKPATEILSGWLVSDRPPLLAGWFLLLRPLLEPLLSIGNNMRLLWLPYQIFGMIASTLWIMPTWDLMKRLCPTRNMATLGTLLVASTGFALFNSTYIWPKMLAAYFGLLAYEKAGLWEGERNWRRAVEAGILVALAMLAHSGVAFGFVGFLALLVGRRFAARLGYCTLMFAVFALLMCPWIYWQKHENPPGNRLIKYALTATFCWGEESKSLWDTFRDRYRNMTLKQWGELKVEALRDLAKEPVVEPESRHHTTWDRVRLFDGFCVVGALGVVNLGWLCLLPFWAGRARNRLRRRCLAFGISGVLLNCLVTLYPQIMPAQSYLAILLLLIPLCSALTEPRLRVLGIPLQVAYFAVVWLISPFSGKPISSLHFCAWMVVGAFLLFDLLKTKDEMTAITE